MRQTRKGGPGAVGRWGLLSRGDLRVRMAGGVEVRPRPVAPRPTVFQCVGVALRDRTDSRGMLARAGVGEIFFFGLLSIRWPAVRLTNDRIG